MKVIHPGRQNNKKLILIVGGGFAGLNAAKTLADQFEVSVGLIDERNHHLFQPLLYQVATAGLNPSDIAVPIRSQFSNIKNVEVHLAKAESINLENKTVTVTDGIDTSFAVELEYDYLILACGARHSYFGHPEWEEFAPGLKTIEQATEIRRRVLLAFETAENELDPAKQAALLNFVIVGGGPTGVELAGAIADISRTVLLKDFKKIDASQAKVILVESGPRILATFAEDLSQKAMNDLKVMGVDVRVSSRVENITQEGAQVGNEFIPSKCVLWAAGVQAAPMKFDRTVEKDKAGRLKVNSDLSLPQFPEVFVVGDLASIQLTADRTVPGLAPAAIQAGVYVAQKILATLRGKSIGEFKYFDKGQMATLGRHRAIVQSGKLKLAGYIAWLAWFFIHILFLVGFKNRISVMAQWIWNYAFCKRGSRLITGNDWRLKK